MSNEKDELLNALQRGHPGGSASLAQNDLVGHTLTIGSTRSSKTWLLEGRKANDVAIKAAKRTNTPYYRQFDKRK